jgi:hypothetical protein
VYQWQLLRLVSKGTCPARTAWERAGGPAGHMAVFGNAAPGCRSVWYRLRHEPGTVAG